MSTFDRFKAFLTAKAAPSADLAKAAADARLTHEEAEATLAKLKADRRSMLTADEATRTKHKRALAEAEDRAADATLYVDELEVRHAEAETREAAAERKRKRDDLEARTAALSKRLAQEYPAAAGTLADLMRNLDANRAEVDEHNRAVGDATDETVERAELRGRYRNRRTRTTLEPRMEQRQARPLMAAGEGGAFLTVENGTHEVTTVEDEGWTPSSLPRGVHLPAFDEGEPAYWRP